MSTESNNELNSVNGNSGLEHPMGSDKKTAGAGLMAGEDDAAAAPSRVDGGYADSVVDQSSFPKQSDDQNNVEADDGSEDIPDRTNDNDNNDADDDDDDDDFEEKDDDDDDDDDDEDDDEDDEDDEDEDEDEDEDDDDDGKSRKRRRSKGSGGKSGSKPVSKRSRRRRSAATGAERFLDVEAAVGERDEDDDDDEGGAGDDLVEEDVDAGDFEQLQREAVERREARARLQEQERLKDGGMAPEELAERLQERWRDYEVEDDLADDDEFGEGAGDSSAVRSAAIVGAQRQIQLQSLLPSSQDPNLWMIKCKPGLEQEIVAAVMRKCLARDRQPDRPQISSVFTMDHLKGFIYVEARKEAFVERDLKGVRGVYYRRTLVPRHEMPVVLRVGKRKDPLRAGDWIRVRSGAYKGDLGQILDPDADGSGSGRLRIRLPPRLNLAKLQEQQAEPQPRGRGRGASSGPRPPIKFFNAEELTSLGIQVQTTRNPRSGRTEYVLGSSTFDDAGYLVKEVAGRTVLTGAAVKPSIDEIQVYQRGQRDWERRRARERAELGVDDDDNDGQAAASESASRTATESQSSVSEALRTALQAAPRTAQRFLPGDIVRVARGDLRGLVGVCQAHDGSVVTIMPDLEELNDALDVPDVDVVKHFRSGDHVKITAGTYEGETGLITNIDEDDDILTIFSDLTMRELQARPQDVRMASEVASGRMSLAGYDLYDLVQLSPTAVGCIVKVESDGFSVLDTNGDVKFVRVAEIGAKRNRRYATSFDAYHNTVGLEDPVTVLDGPHKGKKGTVRHIFRSFAFIHSPQVLDHNGMLTCRTGSLALVGGKGRQSARGLAGASAVPQSPGARMRQAFQSPAALGRGQMGGGGGMGAGARGGSGGRGGGRGGGGGGGRTNDRVGKSVRVAVGPWKGYMGVVRHATDLVCRVELHSKCKTITVNSSDIRELDPTSAASIGLGGSGSLAAGGGGGGGGRGLSSGGSMNDFGRTPMRGELGAMTPMRGELGSAPMTPMRGDAAPMTPMRGDMTPGRTAPPTPGHDVWNPDEILTGDDSSSQQQRDQSQEGLPYDIGPQQHHDQHHLHQYPGSHMMGGPQNMYGQPPTPATTAVATPGGGGYLGYGAATGQPPLGQGYGAMIPNTPITPGAAMTPAGGIAGGHQPGGDLYYGGGSSVPQPGAIPTPQYYPSGGGMFPPTPATTAGGGIATPMTVGGGGVGGSTGAIGTPATVGGGYTPAPAGYYQQPHQEHKFDPGYPQSVTASTPVTPGSVAGVRHTPVPPTPGDLTASGHLMAPAGGMEDAGTGGDSGPSFAWCTAGVYVQYADPQNPSQTVQGVVDEVNLSNQLVTVQRSSDLFESIALTELSPVSPVKRDRVKIISGEHKGATGQLIGIDGQDGIVKLDDLDIKILSLSQLVKFKDK